MFTLNCKGNILKIDKPIIMGIINTTPDSFYDESRVTDLNAICSTVEKMIDEGAIIIDIGGQSSRPGSERISSEEESTRVLPAIKAISEKFPEVIISIDTFYADVAREAVQAGASMVNDISGGSIDKNMISTVAALNVPYILMHMKGEPKTMQESPEYEKLTREVMDFFIERIAVCRIAGVKDIIIDPGIGFGKTTAQNFELFRNLNLFKLFGCPILLGVSRKSLIHKTLGIQAAEALNGTTVLHSFGLMKGADILRVHDVNEAKETTKLFDAFFHKQP
jgi:dihydropteroate synthase